MKFAIPTLLLCIVFAVPALAYEVLLDIDTDDNPYTINQFTEDEIATVKMVLVPEGGSEWISELMFGLGGTCWMCPADDFHMYGTSTDLYDSIWPDPWTDNPLFGDNWVDWALCIDCCGNPGFHALIYADAAGDGFLLEENIFIHTFQAWDIDHDLCDEPPPDLMAFACDGPCNVIMLSGYVATEPVTWDEIKCLY